jgi:hypothetical protein
MAKASNTRLTQTQLAARLKCSQQAISAQAKLPDAPKRGKDGKYELAEWVAFRSVQASMNKAAPKGTYAESLARKAAAQATLAELEVKEKEGAVISMDSIRQSNAAAMAVIQTDIMAMGELLAPVLYGKDMVGIKEEIDKHARRLLSAWHQIPRIDRGGPEAGPVHGDRPAQG